MKIIVGSRNPVKIESVKEAVAEVGVLPEAEIVNSEADSGVPSQPTSLEETIQGAINRAKNVFHNCDYSIGLESGLMEVAHTRTGYMNVTVCAIYNGSDCCLGLSPAFELPKEITELVKKGLEVDEAAYKTGFSKNPRVGYSEGIIGILTGGKLNRKDYMKPAVIMAMSNLDKMYGV